MINNILIFEDDKYSNFLPLTFLRPVYDLISGMSPLLAKIVRQFPETNIHLHCRGYLKNIVKQNHAGIGVNNLTTGVSCLLVNGRLLADQKLRESLNLDGRDRIYITDTDEVAAAYLNTDNLYLIREMMDDVFTSRKIISLLRNKTERIHLKATLVEYPWDLLQAHAAHVGVDFAQVVPAGIIKGELHNDTVVLDEYNVYVGEGTRIMPGVILNAEGGPIYIGENCTIKPHTYIEGPAYLGNNSVVSGSSLYAGAAIGPRSDISNSTIRSSIAHGYATIEGAELKDSYLADAATISAGTSMQTTISPFKKADHYVYVSGERIDVPVDRLGLLAADFCQIGPHTIIDPATVLGISAHCNFSNDLLPKSVSSFLTQTSHNHFEEQTLKEVFDNIQYTLKKKDIEFTKSEQDLIEHVYSKFPADRRVSKVVF
jgi:carbonic anhydrase/acetyltransferase-like protein (isoleucine patch superfamily)